MNGHEPLSAEASRRSPWRGVPLALGLGMALLLVSFARVIGNTQTAMFHDSVLDSVFAGRLLGSALFWNVAAFAGALILLHGGYGLICLALAKLSARAWPAATVPLYQRILIAFIALTVWILASNAERFPRSSLGNPYAKAMHVSWAGLSPATWLGIALLLAVAAMAATAARNTRRSGRARHLGRTPVAAAAVIAAVAISFALPKLGASQPAASHGPNVILIGIDSLREDVVARESSSHTMPHLEEFLAKAVRFSNATTPLARTFPSWVSILTGRRPHVTGAFVNLLPRDLVHEGATLPVLFRQIGYRTEYAIDDVRFSNIDQSYGFDRVVTPPIGASEFVIGFFADTPLSNLVLNTSLGRVLFPFVSGNRAVATTYDPDMFIHRISSEFDFHGPAFLTVHLTLPHWPYYWADAPPSVSDPAQLSATRLPDYYLDATRRADRQFADLLDLLQQRGMLDNAIVVVLSDHGETFGTKDDSLVSRDSSEIANLEAFPGWGHGTSVLAPEQYRTVLAVRTFGRTPLANLKPRRIDAPVSMEDLAPTLAEALNLGSHDPFNGQSLVALLRDEPGGAQPFVGRIRFTESEFNPGKLATQTGELSASALADAANYYQADPVSDRITVKRGMSAALLKRRQYAAVGPHYLIAAIPEPGAEKFEFLLVDQRGGGPQRLSGAPAPDSPAEVQALWTTFISEFGSLVGSPPAAAESGAPRVALAPQAALVTSRDRN